MVDNNSSDGSNEMVKRDFPSVKLIANAENLGFSRANNQAIERAKGDYILLLNPDTIVEESCFGKCVAYMDEHDNCGGLGVKMIDGSGKFLPESKRGLPTPMVAFYKIFGLSALFPKSRRFGQYHLGYLDQNETHAVDVLIRSADWMSISLCMVKTSTSHTGSHLQATTMYFTRPLGSSTSREKAPRKVA